MESPSIVMQRSPRATLTAELIRELSGFGRKTKFGAGAPVFSRGDEGETMYVVEQGEIELIFEHGKARKKLGPGSFFGELALLTGRRPRTAGAAAAADSVLRELDQAAFDQILRDRPALLAVLLVQTCAYLVESEQQLVADLTRRNLELEQSLDYLRRTQQELDVAELRARTDGLTGLYNRRCLDCQIPVMMERACAGRSELAALLIDLDQFKKVNDRFGHQIGDAVLREVASVLKVAVRQTDLPFRLGGDEFLVVMPGMSEDDALLRAEQILASLGARTNDFPPLTKPVRASIGVTLLRQGDTWESLFSRVDHNLYRAKSSGGSRIVRDGE
ncbi:GGDEF domain-containing protein [Candidatus Fermentibacteria bacterium]|nr:GGDEF domain-containing protein [Candidatus Fermentibacteria bacterium]